MNDAEWEAYFDFRRQLLREPLGLPPDTERDEYEFEDDAIQCAAWSGETIIGVGRLHVDGPGVGQVRCMAVHPDWQGRGVGRSILNYLEAGAHTAKLTHVWMNARVEVIGFYTASGYFDVAEGPTVAGVLHHRRMEKCL